MGPRTKVPVIKFGEADEDAIDQLDPGPLLLAGSRSATIHRLVVIDSLRAWQILGGGAAGSKGMGRAILPLLTAWSKAAASLGIVVIVVLHTYEIGSDPKALAALLSEYIGSLTGVIQIAGRRGLRYTLQLSLRRPFSEGGRTPFTAYFNAGAHVPRGRGAPDSTRVQELAKAAKNRNYTRLGLLQLPNPDRADDDEEDTTTN